MSDLDISMHNGQPMMSLPLLGLLCGISEEDARAEFERQALERGHRNAFIIPPAWKRGAKEIQARHGSNDASVLIPLLRAEAGR